MLRSTSTLAAAALGLAAIFSAGPPAEAQNLTGLPDASPSASVEQRFGVTDVRVDYHRPSVRNRQVWGALVPYGQVWRAGANDNTVFTVSTAVTVEGKELAAGSYGLHMIPTETEWTVVFSKNSTSWGSFSYREDEDALRVTVRPEKAPFQESLVYGFEDVTNEQAVVVLHWEELKIPVMVEADTNQLTLASLRNQLRHLPGFGWQGFLQAAQFCLQRDFNHEEALGWIDRSIANDRNPQNLLVKSGLLGRMNRAEESDALVEEALADANEGQTNQIGYNFLFRGEVDRAIVIFQKNTVDYPDSWNTWDSLGEGYAVKGDKAKAVENYKKALGMVEDETQKARIQGILTGLGG